MKRLLLLFVFVSIMSSTSVADVLASVDSKELSWEDLVELIGGPEAITNLGINTESAASDILESWIIEQVILSAAEESNVASRPEVAALIEQTVNQILMEAYITGIINDVEVSRLEVENYIDVWGETYTMKYNVRHILLPDPAVASSVLSRLNSGESFTTLANQFSIGPSAPTGGNLGWMTRGMISPNFMEAVCSLSIGEISGVVETSMGFHIIQLMDRVLLETPITAEETMEVATMEMTSARQEELLIQLIEDLQADHIINSWPDRLLNHI